jgi:hypothetical protein
VRHTYRSQNGTRVVRLHRPREFLAAGISNSCAGANPGRASAHIRAEPTCGFTDGTRGGRGLTLRRSPWSKK